MAYALLDFKITIRGSLYDRLNLKQIINIKKIYMKNVINPAGFKRSSLIKKITASGVHNYSPPKWRELNDFSCSCIDEAGVTLLVANICIKFVCTKYVLHKNLVV